MIRLENVCKNYGNFPAIVDVSFEILRGEVVGFLGPNGAGKTTTMRIITGFTPPSSGYASVGGYDTVNHSLEARKLIGYLPETVPLYLDMTVSDYLKYMGRLRGMSSAQVDRRLPRLIEMLQLGDYRDRLTGKLSKGYRQRTGIAQAIIHEPNVLVLDEPTIGIDPIQVVETREIIKELGNEHTLLLSSHILPEVASVCDRVIVIHDGRIVADDKPSVLSNKLQSSERIEVVLIGPNLSEAIEALRQIDAVVDVRSNPSVEVREKAEREGSLPLIADARPNSKVPQRISETVVGRGWELTHLSLVSMTLEEIFLYLTNE